MRCARYRCSAATHFGSADLCRLRCRPDLRLDGQGVQLPRVNRGRGRMRHFIKDVVCRSMLAGAFTLACGNDDGDTPGGDPICADGECTFTSNLCSPNPCEHGGTCRRGVGDYSCLCEPGFRGDHCEIVDDDCAI